MTTPPPVAQWKVVFLLVLLAALLVFGYLLRAVFTPILLAFALAYLLNPVVKRLERFGLGRTTSIGVLFAGVLIALAAAAALVVPPATVELRDLYQMTFKGEPYGDLNGNGHFDEGEPLNRDINGNGQRDRSYLERASDAGRRALKQWNDNHPDQAIRPEALLQKLKEGVQANLERVTGGVAWVADQVFSLLGTGIQGLLTILSFVILVPIYLFGFLSIYDRVHPAALRLCPAPERDRLAHVLRRIDVGLGGFFRGQVVCGLAKGVITAIGFTFAGTPYGLLLGLLYGCFSIVPYAGGLLIFPLAEIVTVIDAGGIDLGRILGTAAAVGVAELVEGTILVPFIFGKETGLHPLLVLVALFVFGQLLGVFGMLAAIPLTVITKILVEEYLVPIVHEVTEGSPPREAGTGPPAPAPPPEPGPSA
jgi:predicted PurR-regulated permease PerM